VRRYRFGGEAEAEVDLIADTGVQTTVLSAS